MTKNELRKQTMRYLQITIGALIVCLGFNLFIIPAHLLTGGLSGVALIIYYLTGLPVGMQNIVYNLPILYLAYRVFGRLYAWDTIVGTVVLSVILDATHFLVDIRRTRCNGYHIELHQLWRLDIQQYLHTSADCRGSGNSARIGSAFDFCCAVCAGLYSV